ncbi:MAG TPA: hypothetical protein VFG41_07330 [Sphingomicrobium sp.]|nr:hypothetical protein [Sphingomicrobium sp.]
MLVSASLLLCASPAFAQADASLAEQIQALQREVKEQRMLLEQQSAIIAEQQRDINALKFGLTTGELSAMRGMGLAQAGSAPATAPASGASVPDQPVGERPDLPEVEQKVEAVPEGQGVLTPPGVFVFDPSIEYTRSSTNRLVFRGIELVPGIQIGLIEASDADRDTLAATAALRYGLTDRIELEARLPYLYRHDSIQVVQQRDEGIVRKITLKESNIGDAEFAIRYQLNRPALRGQRPIWVASLRVKSDTGKGPFDIDYDEFGVAEGLATGSGFWAVQPGLNFLLPSDPAVIYGGLSYLYHMPRDIDRTIGEAFVGRVDPGDAISANLGFGFALNPRFSFSLGYRHNYIFPTKIEIGTAHERSDRLQVGVFTLGMSYRLTERQSLNFGLEAGVTEDAPDVSVTVRLPIQFGAPWRARPGDGKD